MLEHADPQRGKGSYAQYSGSGLPIRQVASLKNKLQTLLRAKGLTQRFHIERL